MTNPTKDLKGNQPKDREQELAEEIVSKFKSSIAGYDKFEGLCLSVAAGFRKESDQQMALVVEADARKAEAYCKDSVRHGCPCEMESCTPCSAAKNIRSSSPNHAATKARIEREAVEGVECHCHPSFGHTCPRCKTLKALQGKEVYGGSQEKKESA